MGAELSRYQDVRRISFEAAVTEMLSHRYGPNVGYTQPINDSRCDPYHDEDLTEVRTSHVRPGIPHRVESEQEGSALSYEEALEALDIVRAVERDRALEIEDLGLQPPEPLTPAPSDPPEPDDFSTGLQAEDLAKAVQRAYDEMTSPY